MKCLNRYEMQLYIDNELSLEKKNEIHIHVQNCKICLELFNEANKEKQTLFNVLSLCDEANPETNIPHFDIPKRKNKIFAIRALKIAASVALIISLYFIFQKKELPDNKTDNIPISFIEPIDNSDPNKKWHNNQMEIIITDEKGNIVESFISEK